MNKYLFKWYHKVIVVIVILVIVGIGVFLFFRNSEDEKVDIVKDGVESVVPSKETLIKNLTDKGYTIKEYDNIYGLKVGGERVYASKGDSCIDICYGLNKDAAKVFKVFEKKYLSSEYYIIAQNGYFVYYISDKSTFKKSGFKSTCNIGVQYIHD